MDDEEKEPQSEAAEEPGIEVTGQLIVTFRGDDMPIEIGTAGRVSFDQLTMACNKIIQDVTTQKILQAVMSQLQAMMGPGMPQEKAGLIIPGMRTPININDIKRTRS